MTNPIIQQCIHLAQQNPRIDVLWLYGSRAKGTAQHNSDYDFAVAFNSFPADEWEKRLQPELLAQEWAQQLNVSADLISVVDINHIPLPLAYNVITTGIVLHNNNPLRLIREENRVTSMWEVDYLYHLRRYGSGADSLSAQIHEPEKQQNAWW